MRTDINVAGRIASIDASNADLIDPVLQLCVQRFETGGPQGFQQRQDVVRYYVEQHGRLYFPAGLVHRVQLHLEATGHTVEVVDRTSWRHLNRADPLLIRNNTWNQAEKGALQALSKNPRGHLRVGDPDELPLTLALLVRLYAREDVLIVARNRAMADWLAAELNRHSERPVDRDFGKAKHRRPRLLIVTSSRSSTIGGVDFNVVVFADVESALHASVDNVYAEQPKENKPDLRTGLHERLPNATSYLVCDSHPVLTAAEQFRLEAIVGPVIFTAFEQDPRRDIAVAIAPFEADRCKNRKCSGLEHKRRLYWHNTTWNARIAAVAQQIANGVLPVDLHDGITIASNPDICVLVETPEHGVELQRRLLGWPLLTTRSPAAPQRVLMRHRLVTFSHAADHGLEADIVIRADGGADWPLHGVLERAHALVSSRLVIDFTDDRNKRCHADTDSRLAAYERADWSIASRVSRKLLRNPNEPEPVAEN